jgi:hypothetical protein
MTASPLSAHYLKASNMSKPHVCIGLPAYGGNVSIGTMYSLFSDVVAMMNDRWTVKLLDECNNADIVLARSRIVDQFLATEGATHLMFVDSDVVWSSGGIPHLVKHGVDFVAGVYPHRQDPLTWPLHLLDGDTLNPDDTGLFPVKAVPFGFACLSRAGVERMQQEFTKYGKGSTDLFETMPDDDTGERLGEDLAYCQRWRKAGGTVYIDPSIQMGHIGLKLFTGKLGDFHG